MQTEDIEIEEMLGSVPERVHHNGFGFSRSSSIGKLTEALAKASAEFERIIKDTENPYFRSAYASLDSLIDATRPSLSKYGLVVMQPPERAESGAAVRTIISHVSGEWVESYLALPASKQDAQGLGSAITYARRYAYQSILNIAGEEDDDGNAATGKTQHDRQSVSTEGGEGAINPVQLRAFNSACKTGGRTEKQVADYLLLLGRKSVEELNKVEFQTAIKWALNPNPGSSESFKQSVKVEGIKKRQQQSLEITDDDMPTNRCLKHGDFKGEGDCPKCVIA